MNAWNCNQLGAGGGYPGGAINLPGAGTAITNPSAISAWQASAATMNAWGQSYQTGRWTNIPNVADYGPGVFQGTALTAGRPCARYYRHFHSEQGKWIQNTGTKYDNHYISELVYTETDASVAFAQSDQCWLLDGLWMAGGSAPSVGLQPNGQGKNRLVQPDLMERYQDFVHTFHIKDLGPNDQGTQVRNVGDNDGPGAATYPYGAVPWSPGQDTVPFQEIYERFRHPELHEYLFERDGQSNTVTSNAYWKKLYVQVGDMFDKLVLKRDPNTIREPYAVPETDAEWVAASWVNQPQGYRPAAVNGAPGPECPPELNGKTEIGQLLNVQFRGTWARFNDLDSDQYSYLWLRDGAPINALYKGAPLQPCGAVGERSYVIQKEDSGHQLSCQVTAFNDGAATSVVTAAVTVEGGWSKAMDDALVALSATVVAMGLEQKWTDWLTGKIERIRRKVSGGENVCADLDEFKAYVTSLAKFGRATDEQAAKLNADADAIKAKSPTPC